jgi:hypothetical protein
METELSAFGKLEVDAPEELWLVAHVPYEKT